MSNNPPQPPPPPLEHTNFLKIPRIRLKKNKGHALFHHQENNNKSSSKYIETGHLVNGNLVNNMIGGNNSVVVDGSSDDSNSGGGGGGETNRTRIIKPKKLPNPIKDSQAMQSIHKELLLNQKIGRSVLTHKTELQKAIEKLAVKTDNNPPPLVHHHHHHPQHHHQQKTTTTTTTTSNNEFQKILDARAKLIEEQKCFVDGESRQAAPSESEFEKIHKRVTSSKQPK